MSALRVDAHVHVYDYGYWPEKWFDFVAAKWATEQPGRQPSEVRGRVEAGMADPGAANLVSQMDEVGIDVSVVLTLDWELGMGQGAKVPIEQIHAEYEAIAQSSRGRIVVFAGLDPRRPNAPELLAQLIERGVIKGLKLYPPTGFYPFDEVVLPLLDLCQSAGLPVVFHTGGTIGLLSPRYANPLYIQDVQAQFPSLRIWLAHAGAKWWWEEAVAVAANGIGTYLELSSWQEVALEEEERFVAMLDKARRRLGVGKLIFGSDHFSGPRVRGTASLQEWYRWWEELPKRAKAYGVSFSDAEVDAILGGNASECLGLSELGHERDKAR